MYQPPHFREERADVQQALIRAFPLGLLVTAGPGGLMANPVPFTLYPDEGGHGVLRAHLARANAQVRELGAVDECLIVFQGPQEYVTPSWYATKRETGRVVPTWNYATVHVRARPAVIEDAVWLRRQIDDLTALAEGRRTEPWKVEDAPPEFIAGQLKGIIGIELPVLGVEGKWKVSQNRNPADREGVVEGLRDEGREAMADLVARYLAAARQGG